MNVMILENLEQFHNSSLFKPFSELKLNRWSDIIYGEFLEHEDKSLYVVHNCYTPSIFLIKGEIIINGSDPLNFKYQKICPQPENRNDLKLKV